MYVSPIKVDMNACVCAKSLQSCPTLCDPMDCSLPDSSVHEISLARIQEWVAISFSRGCSQPRDHIHICLHNPLKWVWLYLAIHSSILSWRILWTAEPGGLQSMGLHRVRHDWSNLAWHGTHLTPWDTCLKQHSFQMQVKFFSWDCGLLHFFYVMWFISTNSIFFNDTN